MSDVANMEALFVSSNNEVCRVEKWMKDLELAMQKARQVRRCPALESYLNLESVCNAAFLELNYTWFNLMINSSKQS